MTKLFFFTVAILLFGCAYPQEAGVKDIGNNVRIQEYISPSGTICIIATESGHGLAMQCNFKEPA